MSLKDFFSMTIHKNSLKNKKTQDRMLLKTAKRVFKIESDAVASLGNRLGGDFPNVVYALSNRKGRLIITGMGKSGLIGQKISRGQKEKTNPTTIHFLGALFPKIYRETLVV